MYVCIPKEWNDDVVRSEANIANCSVYYILYSLDVFDDCIHDPC